MKVPIRCDWVTTAKKEASLDIGEACKTCDKRAYLEAHASGELNHVCDSMGSEFGSLDRLMLFGYIDIATIPLLGIRALLEQVKDRSL